MTNRHIELSKQIWLLLHSDHIFSPRLMKGLIYANFEAMDRMDEDDSIGGLQSFLGLMVSMCYDTPMHDEKVISDEAWEVVSNKPLPAKTIGKFLYYNVQNINEIMDAANPEFIQSYMMGLAATAEIAAEELEREVAA
jgi:hypothetical protein